MARITVEDCLTKETNRFALVLLAAKRTKQLLQGAKARINDARSNKAVVTSLREIADGKVRFMTSEEENAGQEDVAEVDENLLENNDLLEDRNGLPANHNGEGNGSEGNKSEADD